MSYSEQWDSLVNYMWTLGTKRINLRFPDLPVSAGIKLTLSALLDGKNINAGGHKLGLGLEFQA